ncbi:MAG: PAS domain S-box protein [Desulfobulbaceae bacterium]|nr:MAG: PAS domain S-box protein [Desulfobulbaceae bacterium]
MKPGYFINTITERVNQAPLNEDEKLRLKHFLVFLCLGLPAMSFYGLYNFFNGYLILGFACFFTAIFLLISGWFLLQAKKGSLIYRCGAACYLCLLLYSLVSGGDDGSKSLWVFTFPLVTFFLLGKREGVVWSSLFGLILLLYMNFVSTIIPSGYLYSGEYTVRLLTVYLFVAILSFWFEHFRESYNRQLRQKNLIFQETLDHSRDILYRRDLETGKYQYISEAFGVLLGHDLGVRRGVQYENINELIHPDDRKTHGEILQSLISAAPNEPQEATLEYRMKHKDGHYLWFSDRIQVIPDRKGTPEFILGINREITSQREARQALTQMKDRLFTILNSIDAHVYVADMKTYRILFMNNKMIDDFNGNYVGEICYRAFRNLHSPCKHCTNSQLIDAHNQAAGVVEWENYNPITERWYKNHDRAVQWLDGSWVRIQIALDITRLKEMEAERLRNEETLRKTRHFEAISSLAGGVAHDFNNLLQSIYGYCELIEFDPKSMNQHIDQTRVALAKAVDLANYLKSFASGGNHSVSEVELRTLIDKSIADIGSRDEIEMDVSIPAQFPTLLVDEQQMSVALGNLIRNSFESIRNKGNLKITARLLGNDDLSRSEETAHTSKCDEVTEFTEITISDDGCGIPSESLEKVFDPYYSTKELGTIKGQGLGLSIANAIIQKHGGALDIASRQNEGTNVTLTLPSARKKDGSSV